MSDAPDLQSKMEHMEMELLLLRQVVAHLAAFADPQARVAIVRKLTAPGTMIPMAQSRTDTQNETLSTSARTLLTMIATSAN